MNVKGERDRLIDEKAKLASELQRIQNLLHLKVEVDRKQTGLLEKDMIVV
jgi:hypothetical protein